MQPYIFPYIGYWQLINMADTFVILDDVNYIMRGYINRNSILLDSKAHMFSIPMDHPSQNKLIMDTRLRFNKEDKERFLKMIYFSYRKAKCFEQTYSLIEQIIMNEECDLTGFIENSFRVLCEYMDIHTIFQRSSRIPKDNTLKGEQRILEICKKMNADVYVNPIGGVDLYHADSFAEEGIQLYFLNMKQDEVVYQQFKNQFVGNLSIIDALMFNTREEMSGLLQKYELLKNSRCL